MVEALLGSDVPAKSDHQSIRCERVFLETEADINRRHDLQCVFNIEDHIFHRFSYLLFFCQTAHSKEQLKVATCI